MGERSARLVQRVTSLAGSRGPEDLDVLREHGVHLLAISEWRRRGRVPPDAVALQRDAGLAALATEATLRSVRAVATGPLVVLKGVEVAARWPHRSLRVSNDVDVLAPDARRVQAELQAAGWRVVERSPPDHHHLDPLQHPDSPIRVEVHGRVNWVPGRSAPATGALLEQRQPSVLAVEGLDALGPEAQACVVAVNGWRRDPLGRLADLVDVAVLADEEDRVVAWARENGIEPVLATTFEAVDAVAHGREPTDRFVRWAGADARALRPRRASTRGAARASGTYRAAGARVAARRLFAEVRGAVGRATREGRVAP